MAFLDTPKLSSTIAIMTTMKNMLRVCLGTGREGLSFENKNKIKKKCKHGVNAPSWWSWWGTAQRADWQPADPSPWQTRRWCPNSSRCVLLSCRGQDTIAWTVQPGRGGCQRNLKCSSTRKTKSSVFGSVSSVQTSGPNDQDKTDESVFNL